MVSMAEQGARGGCGRSSSASWVCPSAWLASAVGGRCTTAAPACTTARGTLIVGEPRTHHPMELPKGVPEGMRARRLGGRGGLQTRGGNGQWGGSHRAVDGRGDGDGVRAGCDRRGDGSRCDVEAGRYGRRANVCEGRRRRDDVAAIIARIGGAAIPRYAPRAGAVVAVAFARGESIWHRLSEGSHTKKRKV